MIIITGHIRTDPSEVHALLADLRSGIERTQGEDGCLFYAFALADPTAGTILAAERWRDEASLAAHLGTPEVAALFGRWAGKLDISVVKHDASNERPVM